MKNNKKNNLSNYKKFETANGTLVNEIDRRRGLHFPMKPEWREKFCLTIKDWSKRENSWELMQFLFEYDIPRRTFYNWKDNYPEVEEAIEEASLMLASKRRLAATFGGADKYMVLRDLYRYDSEERENDLYQKEMKADVEPNQKIIINIPQALSSPEVPPLEKTNETTS